MPMAWGKCSGGPFVEPVITWRYRLPQRRGSRRVCGEGAVPAPVISSTVPGWVPLAMPCFSSAHLLVQTLQVPFAH